ncbi:MAG: DNA-directed RNA polymerase subunit omega [Nitrospinae bacterium]|nr:DNA-directed RNA polymerase subunit omega [Nitrospinota bacterium]
MFSLELFTAASKKVPQRYLLANLVTMRVRQLTRGADPLVDPEDMQVVDVALKEIATGMVEPRKEVVPTSEDLFKTTTDDGEETQE